MTLPNRFLTVLRLTASLLCGVLNGIDLSFNVYAVPLKETFNFTQTQVELVASMICIGSGLSFLEATLTRGFGYTTTFLVTWITLPLSFGLFALAAFYKDFFHDWPLLVCFIHFLMFASNAVAYVVITRICLEIIPVDYTGTFIGTFGAAVCFGKIVFAGLFELFNDICGFFVCLSVTFAVALAAAFALLYPVAIKLGTETKPESEGREEVLGFTEIVRCRSFHMMLWSSAVFAGSSFVILNNITMITDSIGIQDPIVTATIMSVCIMTTRLLYGLVYDKVSSELFGFVLLFSGYFSFVAALLLGMYDFNTVTVHILTVLFGIAIGPSLYLPLGILVRQYGHSNYRYISTSLFAVMAVYQIIVQVISGFLYDVKRLEMGSLDNDCLGSECFFWSYFVLFVVTIIVCVVQSVNLIQTVFRSSPGQ